MFEKDSRKYRYSLPECMNEGEGSLGSNIPERPRDLGQFILDELLTKGKKIRDALLQRYETHEKPKDDRSECMTAPCLKARRCVKEEVDAVETFVEACLDDWKQIHAPGKKDQNQEAGTSTGAARKASTHSNAARLLLLRSLAARFNEGPTEGAETLQQLGLLREVVAACAYSHRPIFAFNVAFDALCTIRAEHSGQLVPLTQTFAGYMSMSSSARRVLARVAAPPE